jgi:hypothetical protein
MLEVLAPFAPFVALLLYALIGSVVRLFWGMYKAYTTLPFAQFSAERLAMEMLAGIVFGTAGGMILQEMGVLHMAVGIGTVVSAVLGPNVVELVAKKFGWSKKLDIVVTEQQIGMADLNMRQINGLGYASQRGRITNREYQRINETNRNTATYDLKGLVLKGRLKRTGNVKSTSYVPVPGRLAGNTMKKIR